MEHAIRPFAPQAGRELPDIVPRPPPPDWTLESAPKNPFEVDTSCPTVIATLPFRPMLPIRVDTSAPVRPERVPERSTVALGCYLAAVALLSLGLAFWQLYWFLESSESGRALLDLLATAIAPLTEKLS